MDVVLKEYQVGAKEYARYGLVPNKEAWKHVLTVVIISVTNSRDSYQTNLQQKRILRLLENPLTTLSKTLCVLD